MKKLSILISSSFLGKILDERVNCLDKLDTSHFYVEQIRHLLGTTTVLAYWVCELLVTSGALEKRVGYLSPIDGHILESIIFGEDPPDELVDEIAEAIDEPKHRFSQTECKTIIFYRMIV